MMIDNDMGARETFFGIKDAEVEAHELQHNYEAGAVATHDPLLRGVLALLDEDVVESFGAWMATLDPVSAGPAALMICDMLTPDDMAPYLQHHGGREMLAGSAQREHAMATRVLDMCGGEATGGQPCKSVMVVLGQAHVPSLPALLRAGAGARRGM